MTFANCLIRSLIGASLIAFAAAAPNALAGVTVSISSATIPEGTPSAEFIVSVATTSVPAEQITGFTTGVLAVGDGGPVGVAFPARTETTPITEVDVSNSIVSSTIGATDPLDFGDGLTEPPSPLVDPELLFTNPLVSSVAVDGELFRFTVDTSALTTADSPKQLTMKGLSLVGQQLQLISAADGLALPIDSFFDGSITITAVPEPSAFVTLSLVATLGLGRNWWKRTQRLLKSDVQRDRQVV